MGSKSSAVKKLGVMSLVMITVGSVDSIRNLPASAQLGSHLIFFYLLGALLFFIPSAFIAAELSSNASQRAGVYDWVKNAFGARAGVCAVWFQWTENLFWYPLILSLVVNLLFSSLFPQLSVSSFFIRCCLSLSIVVLFWLITFVNLSGIRASALFATFCTLSGLIIPFLFIIVMGVIWHYSGFRSHLSIHYNNLIPGLGDKGWGSLTVIMLSLMGIEVATVHSNNVERPSRAYPIALLISSMVLLSTLIGGSLAIAYVLPVGSYDSFDAIGKFFMQVCSQFKLGFLVPCLIIAVVIGLIGSVNNWVIAPSSGLRYAAKQGDLPTVFRFTNSRGSPAFMLIIQAVIVTFISVIFLIQPSLQRSFNLLSAIASQQYACMYILMFAAAVKLRLKNGKQQSGFNIPGGNSIIIIFATLGIFSMLAVITVGFIPPVGYTWLQTVVHESIMLGGMLFFLFAILLLHHFSRVNRCAGAVES
jgi:glutamate:GABA antiporter